MSRARFIAGAVCPRCGAMDRLVLESDDSRRCVACGYEDALDSAASQAPKTRLDGGLKQPAGSSDEAPSVVRILEPARKRNPKPDPGSGSD